MIKRLLLLLLTLLPFSNITLFAARPNFQAEIDITNVVEIAAGVNYKVYGKVSDFSVLGYMASDVKTNDVIFTENVYGEVDIFKITNIISAGSVNLAAYVLYDPIQTGVSSLGPVIGIGAICTITTNTLELYLPPSLTGARISEHMHNSIRNYVSDRINVSIGTTLKYNLTNYAGVQSIEGNAITKTPTGFEFSYPTNLVDPDDFANLSNRFAIVETNYANLPDFLTLSVNFDDVSNRFAIVETNYAGLPDFLDISNRFAIVETNYAGLPDFLDISNRFAIVETNYANLPDFLTLSGGFNDVSNRFAVVETNYANLPDFLILYDNFDNISNRFLIVENNTSYLTNAVQIESNKITSSSGDPLWNNGPWPGISSSEGIFGTHTVTGLINTVILTTNFSTAINVVISLQDPDIDRIVQPEIISTTTNGFQYQVRTIAGLTNTPYTLSWQVNGGGGDSYIQDNNASVTPYLIPYSDTVTVSIVNGSWQSYNPTNITTILLEDGNTNRIDSIRLDLLVSDGVIVIFDTNNVVYPSFTITNIPISILYDSQWRKSTWRSWILEDPE